ncbi:MAG: putative chromosome-partitioning protein ParB [Candidatus Tyloplasma litorale]|nr:MAG: putative chromosome-partitioning protein ParB [Mycoplasmatales bacterium]
MADVKDNKKKVQLGKGLNAIFGGDVQKIIDYIQENRINGTISEVEISKLIPNPYQPRKTFNEKELKQLALSIQNNGLFTPILIKKNQNGTYYIVAGERRTRACKLLGYKKIKAFISDLTNKEMQKITLIENVQREDLNPIEVARSLEKMISEQHLKQEEVAKAIGKSRSYVANLLGILKLDDYIIDAILDKKISYGHARTLISLEKEESKKVFDLIINKKLSVHEAENYIKKIKLSKNNWNNYKKIQNNELIKEKKELENKLNLRIDIKDNKVVVSFRNRAQIKKTLKNLNDLLKNNLSENGD